MIVASIILVSVSVSLALLLGKSWTLLFMLVVVCGVIKVPLASMTHVSALLLIDGIPAILMILSAMVLAFKGEGADSRALGLYLVLALLVALAVFRAPSAFQVAVQQAQQVLVPVGLVFAGYVLRNRIQWVRLLEFAALIAVLVAVWALAEEVLQAPLISPVWYYTEAVGGLPSSLRNGLPPSYYADGVGGLTIFRPGGPFGNPPTLGILLGTGAFAAAQVLKGTRQVGSLVVIAAALVVSYARAGILLFSVAVLLYVGWAVLGKAAGLAVSLAVGVYVFNLFVTQGNTATHATGLSSGLVSGLTNPIGVGFGTTGYQAFLHGASVSVGAESLLGLYFAWLGWPMIAGVFAALYLLIRKLVSSPRTASRPIFFALGAILVAAATETASSVAATPIMWMFVGFTFAGLQLEGSESSSASEDRGGSSYLPRTGLISPRSRQNNRTVSPT